MEVLIIAGIASLGYYLNKDQRQKNNKLIDNNIIVPENQKPSGDNIYSSRHLEKSHEKEFALATQNYKKSENPLKTGIINADTFKKRQDNKYEEGIDIIQEEEEIKKTINKNTTKFPSSSESVINNSKNLLASNEVEDFGILNYNEKRNIMPNPTFEIIPDNENVIFKTVKNSKFGKGVNVYETGHNNMEPFFGSSVKQNMDNNVNKTLLEKFTGTDVIYRHKKETKMFFKPEKNTEVFGQKIQRDDTRYIPSVAKNNILPFEQIKVGRGLNKSADKLSTNVGFHDMYRPTEKNVDQLRVKPKLTYKARISGEKHFVANRGMESKVISNKAVDRYLTNFDPNTKEGFENIRYRPLVPNKSQVLKTTHLGKEQVVLKNVERNKYTEAIDKFKGIIKKGFGLQSSLNDDARTTIKQQTEVNKNPYTNPNGERRQQVNPYDEAKTTIKEQYEEHKHKYMNPNKEVKDSTMKPFDDAKNTIKQQTENNKHSHINPNGPEEQQMKPFDDAKTTIKEQTENRTYNAPKGSSETFGQQSNRYNYYNAEINALKEQTIHRRAPVSQGAKVGPEKKQYNVMENFRKVQHNTYEHQKRLAPTAPKTNSIKQIGNFTRNKQMYSNNQDCDRLNPVYVEQFKKNPYSQSLNSYLIPYNPKSVER